MFSDRIVLVATDLEAASELREVVAQCNPFHELEVVDAREVEGWQRFLESLAKDAPDLAFVQVHSFRDIAEVLEPLQKAAPMLPILVFCRKMENHAFLELLRLGFGNRIIHLPAKREIVDRAAGELRARHERPAPMPAELCPLVSILPGKPGSGASTLAWHFANICAEAFDGPVALLDLDLNCGVQSLFAGAQTGISLFDAISFVDHSGRMPERHHIPGRNGVDILSAMRRCRSSRIDTSLFANFLSAARSTYRLVVADHSGNWERFSVEAMRASSVIYCVCQSDYLSLTLASRTCELTEEEGLLGRMQMVLNRYASRYAVAPEQAEILARMRMAAGLPNCFGELQQAAKGGYLAGKGTPYWAAVQSLALRTLKSLHLLGEENLAASGGNRAGGWLHSLGIWKKPGPRQPELAGRR